MDNLAMMELNDELTEELEYLLNECMRSGEINQGLYIEYDVKRGLRDSNGNGVLTGLTEISDVVSSKIEGGRKVPDEGALFYQGYDVREVIDDFKDKRFLFEETTYLLLFGELPTRKQLTSFVDILNDFRMLSNSFLRDVIMKAANPNIMNSLQRAILTMYSYDDKAEDISVENVLRQSMSLIAKMPLLAVYAYWSYRHAKLKESLLIRNPNPHYSTAENILAMLRPDGKFTPLEAKVLDVALVLHAEHGGGNNSTFTTHVVTSSGTDTYSTIAAAIASLKGFRHGGANLKVKQMFEDIKEHVKNWEDEEEICDYLIKIMDKQAFDHSGLIYGMGHAVYTLSDPREVILKEYAQKLAEEKGLQKEFAFYDRVEKLAKDVMPKHRQFFKPICANVDFYSGFVYQMLGIPDELFTPLFATARITGWSAHRLEEIINRGKIIRPAYKFVGVHKDFVEYDNRFWC